MPSPVPVIVVIVWALTPVVWMVNVAVVLPLGTVTDAGTVAELLLLVSVTTSPPGPAASLSVSVPIALLPPRTEVGVTVKDPRPQGLIVRIAVADTPFNTAVMVVVSGELKPAVVTVKVALF